MNSSSVFGRKFRSSEMELLGWVVIKTYLRVRFRTTTVVLKGRRETLLTVRAAVEVVNGEVEGR